MFILDDVYIDSAMSIRSCVHLGLSLLLLDLLHLGLFASSHSHGYSGFAMFVWGRSCLGFALPVSDAIHFGPLPSLRSMARFGFSPSVLDFLHLDSLPFAQSHARRPEIVEMVPQL